MRVEQPPEIEKVIAAAGLGAAADLEYPMLLNSELADLIGPEPYPHWEQIKRRNLPDGVTHEQLWTLIKLARILSRRRIALNDKAGVPFAFGTPDPVIKLLHAVDKNCGGQIAMPAVVTGGSVARQRFIVNSRMEEAIRSSQLEGATTTRRVAKEMLRSGRKPSTTSERMIANNYRAMEFVKNGLGSELTPAGVCELHAIVTEGTLDDPAQEGRIQKPEEQRVSVIDALTGEPVHRPPDATELVGRMQAMCEFANTNDDDEAFMHPAIRAIILHFWLAYDHPFADGNGRTARALFYWYMLQHEFWMVEFLSISRVLRAAPAQYSRAFLYTETDENDLTYFLIHQLRVLVKSTEDLFEYLEGKAAEIDQVESLSKEAHLFNSRQLALLGLAIKDSSARFTFHSHASSHGVTHESARNDVTELWSAGLLTRKKEGRNYVFAPSENLSRRLKKLSSSSASVGQGSLNI